jgi:hypothetical protein
LTVGWQSALHYDASAAGGRVETDCHLDVVDRARPDKTFARLPSRDPSQLQALTCGGVVHLEQATTDTGLTSHPNRSSGIVKVDRASEPPTVDLLSEDLERSL